MSQKSIIYFAKLFVDLGKIKEKLEVLIYFTKQNLDKIPFAGIKYKIITQIFEVK